MEERTSNGNDEPMDPNQNEIVLLRENPGELLILYQPLIQVILQVFIKAGHFRKEEKEELMQLINDEVLAKIEKIKSQYNGMALLRTYFSSVVRNICLERMRERERQKIHEVGDLLEEPPARDTDVLSRLIIRQELERLAKILVLFHRQRPKLELCLKAFYRLPVRFSDFFAYNSNCPIDELRDEILFLGSGEPSSEKEIFRHMTSVINRCEGKNVTSDSVRKWLKTRITELIELLNGKPGRSNYDEETLQILIEKYYMEMQGPPGRMEPYTVSGIIPASIKKY